MSTGNFASLIDQHLGKKVLVGFQDKVFTATVVDMMHWKKIVTPYVLALESAHYLGEQILVYFGDDLEDTSIQIKRKNEAAGEWRAYLSERCSFFVLR